MTEIIQLKYTFTGNESAKNLVMNDDGTTVWMGVGIEAGLHVALGTATTVDVQIKDALGRILYNKTNITANTTYTPVANGVKGPLTVTTANISNPLHTGTVYMAVKV